MSAMLLKVAAATKNGSLRTREMPSPVQKFLLRMESFYCAAVQTLSKAAENAHCYFLFAFSGTTRHFFIYVCKWRWDCLKLKVSENTF